MLIFNLFLRKFKGLGLSPDMTFIDIVIVECIKAHRRPSWFLVISSLLYRIKMTTYSLSDFFCTALVFEELN